MRRVHAATKAQGAGVTGLSRVIEMHGVNTAGDTLIAISLAGTLFFAVPLGEARSNVALYLIMTMLPFALLAPLIGPTLDRFRHGRRWALGSTLALRGFLCWVLASAVPTGHISIYPAAFGCLVASKAYNVSRAASVPRLLPTGVQLVTANSRVSVAGVLGATFAAVVGVGLASVGPQWSLRLGFLVFVAGTVLAIRLPSRIDSSVGEVSAAALRAENQARSRLSAPVVASLRANASLRMLSGFLTMFLAFLLRDQPVGGIPYTVTIGLVAVFAGLGSTSATALGASFTLTRPDVLILLLVSGALAMAGLGALLYGLATVLAVGLASGFAQQLGKLCQDAIIQREVDERVRTSAFARAETLMQLAWVLGGSLGITLPLQPRLGLGVIAVLLAIGLLLAFRSHRMQRSALA